MNRSWTHAIFRAPLYLAGPIAEYVIHVADGPGRDDRAREAARRAPLPHGHELARYKPCDDDCIDVRGPWRRTNGARPELDDPGEGIAEWEHDR